MAVINELPWTKREQRAEELVLLIKALSDSERLLRELERTEGESRLWRRLIEKRDDDVQEQIASFASECIEALFKTDGRDFPAAAQIARDLVFSHWNNTSEEPAGRNALASWLRAMASGCRLVNLT